MSPCDWEAACHHGSTCGLTGSSAFFDSIPGSFTLINGPLWCYFYAMKYVDNENPMASQRFSCTQPGPNSLVYGTEADLKKGFDTIKSYGKPERVFVTSNCSVSLVGDDTQGIADRLELPWPVYAMDSGGLKGSFEAGFSAASLRVEQEMKSLPRKEQSVNVLGLSTTCMKGREDGAEIRRLLTMAGIAVVSMPGGGDTWDTIMAAPSAALNVVVRDELGLSLAKKMEADFGIPYVSVGLPYGVDGTIRWVKKIIDTLGAGDSTKVEEEGKKEKEYLFRKGNNLESLWGGLWFDHILISAPPSEAAGMAEAIRSEMADTAKLTIHFQAKTDLIVPAADEIRHVSRDDALIKKDYETWDGGLVLSSSHETMLLTRMGKKFTFFHIALPSHDEVHFSDVPFCGLRGTAYLYEQLWNAKFRNR
ncbi:MAG TPA: oxidoreductase [Dialister sp.]|nr:oxidoreductase [Dialister sp.]